MKLGFIRATIQTLALCLLATSVALAADVTATEKSVISNDIINYFQAVLKNDTTGLGALMAPSFVVVTPKGDKISRADALTKLGQMYTAAGGTVMPGDFKLVSMTKTGSNIVAVVKSSITANINYSGNATVTKVRNSTHQMTWVDSGGGKWLCAEDKLLAVSN